MAISAALSIVVAGCAEDEGPPSPDLFGDASTPDSGLDASTPGTDAGLDASTPDLGSDAGIDGGFGASDDGGVDGGDDEDGSSLDVTLDIASILADYPPDTHSTFGFASDADPYDGAGTSWRYQKTPSTADPAEKFELYLPFTFEDAATPPPAMWDELRAHLGAFTVADIASIEVHTRRDLATSPDFTMVVFTTPTGTSDDASWYHHRLHAELQNAASSNAPVGQWNAFSTDAGTNQILFWDYRNSNTNAGEQPSDNYFTLADMQAGPVVPAGTALEARDYRAETVKFVAFMTYSNATEVDASIDGITLRLTDGREALVHLEGTATPAPVLRASVSMAALLADYPPSAGSSYGEVTTENPFGGSGASLRYVKDGDSPAGEKFEIHLPFTFEADVTPPPSVWDAVRAHLGAFTVADIASIRVSTRRNDATTPDFTMLVYTTPTDDPGDSSWYRYRLHAELANADMLNAPASTWNTYSTSAGENQIRFWDYRNSSVGAGEQPSDNYFTLADMQAGPVVPAGTTLEGRDYRAETVKFLTFSTYSNYTAFDGSIDGIEIRLTNGRVLALDVTD
jgi:hypothetical protein